MLLHALNHLWQSTAFAAAAGLLALLLRKNHARARHAVWMAASLKFLVPWAVLVGAGSQVPWRTPAPVAAPRVSAAIEEIAAPMTWSWQAGTPVPQNSSTVVWIAWAAGCLAVSFRWASRWRRMRAIVRSAARVEMALPIAVRSSRALVEPGVFGIVNPILLLPAGIAGRLSPAQLQAILAHELCHVRRRDNLAAALHMAVEAIFWFHPLVWWIGARLVEERERACDEEVLRLGNRPEDYAGSILGACRLYLESPLPCVCGVTGADLERRIERIMTPRAARNLGLARKLLLASAAILAIAAPFAIGLLDAQTLQTFEVASVKINQSGERPGHITFPGVRRFTAVNIPFKALLMMAYDVNLDQISGGPDWLDKERFDVDAKPERATTPAGMRAMLQNLLAERFHLVLRRESREEPVYVLLINKGGPKLRPHQEAAGEAADRIRPGPDGQVIFQGVPLSRLAWFLGTRVQRQVLDRTGIEGSYDFELAWGAGERPGLEGPGSQPPDATGPSIFTAVREQLGLRLESQKGPVEYLTIQHVEKPTEN